MYVLLKNLRYTFRLSNAQCVAWLENAAYDEHVNFCWRIQCFPFRLQMVKHFVSSLLCYSYSWKLWSHYITENPTQKDETACFLSYKISRYKLMCMVWACVCVYKCACVYMCVYVCMCKCVYVYVCTYRFFLKVERDHERVGDDLMSKEWFSTCGLWPLWSFTGITMEKNRYLHCDS